MMIHYNLCPDAINRVMHRDMNTINKLVLFNVENILQLKDISHESSVHIKQLVSSIIVFIMQWNLVYCLSKCYVIKNERNSLRGDRTRQSK